MDKTKAAIRIFDAYASQYADKYMSVEKYHPSLNVFLENLNTDDARVLELACGPGNLTKYLLTKRPGLDILATDLSPSMLELARVNNPGAHFQKLDCRSIMDLKLRFDAILCGFGLPYLSKEDSIRLIEDSSRILSDGGLLYISFMEGAYEKSGYTFSSDGTKESLFTYYHEEEYLKDAFLKNGLNILHSSRVVYSDKSGEVVDLIMIGKKS